MLSRFWIAYCSFAIGKWVFFCCCNCCHCYYCWDGCCSCYLICAPPPNNCCLFAEGAVGQRLSSLLSLSFFQKESSIWFSICSLALLIRFMAWTFTFIPPRLLRAAVEEPTPSTSQADMFSSLSPRSKPEEGWPSLSAPASSVQPAQWGTSMPASWTAQMMGGKSPQGHVGSRGSVHGIFRVVKFCPCLNLCRKCNRE